MPNRIIKESITTSDKINCLSWFDEVLFYRLIVVCDDYGRFDGRPAVIKSMCFPLKDGVTAKAVSDAISRLVSAGLVSTYTVERKPTLCLPGWDHNQQIRAKRSKYPAPEDADIICNQMISNDIKCNQMISHDSNCTRNPIQSESESESIPPLPPMGELDRALERFVAHRKEIRHPIGKTGIDSLRKRLQGYSTETAVAMIEQSISNGWQGVFELKTPVKKDPARTGITDAELEKKLLSHGGEEL